MCQLDLCAYLKFKFWITTISTKTSAFICLIFQIFIPINVLIQMKTTIHMIALVGQIQFMVHSMAKIHHEINLLANHSRPQIRWNIKQGALERILQLIKFTHSKVCLNRLTTLMLSWGKNWAWTWAYQKQESKFGFKTVEQNLENKKQDQEMISQSWTDPVHRTISTELGWVTLTGYLICTARGLRTSLSPFYLQQKVTPILRQWWVRQDQVYIFKQEIWQRLNRDLKV